MTVQEYVSAFTILVRKLLRAGGSTTDQRKIQSCLQGAGRVARNGFDDYIKQVKLNGKYTGQEYMQWSAFSSVMGRIGMLSVGSGGGVGGEDQQAQAGPEESVEAQGRAAGMHVVQGGSPAIQDDAAVFKAAVEAAVKAALAGRRTNEGERKSAACNNWDYTGVCSYGDRCRFSHDAVPGHKGRAHDENGKAEAQKKECNHCTEPDCTGCGVALLAKKPGMHAIGWKRWSNQGEDSDEN